jgi:hypothetical protein
VINEDEHDREAFRRMFQAVLAQAALHALGRPFDGQWPSEEDRRTARRWFLSEIGGLELCCLWAGVPAAVVRREMAARVRDDVE